MYGYLRPYIPELKIQDYRIYRSYCCGVCSQLRADYGLTARLLLNHDMVLLALLADCLAGREGTTVCKACPRHWFKKQCMMRHTKGIRYAANVEVILAWHQINNYDPWRLNSRAKFRFHLEKWILKKAYRKAVSDGRQIDRLLQQERDHAAALEMAKCTDYDAACEPSGNFYGALFAACAPDESAVKPLRRVGFYVGKIYYLLESAEYFESDRLSGRYNIFVLNGLTREAALESAKSRCNMAAVELARAYNLLGVKLNRSLLDNIIFLGLEQTVEKAGQKQQRKWEMDEIT